MPILVSLECDLDCDALDCGRDLSAGDVAI